MAYDHPFIDGNGRTARALFYWAMLHGGYWLFEFISISSIIRKTPSKYNKSFLYTETDENDLTYFIVAQTEVINRSIKELHHYINRKTEELRSIENNTEIFKRFNHRQIAIIKHALKHPGQIYTFSSHQKSHGIVYQTARTNLLQPTEIGLIDKTNKRRSTIFVSPKTLSDRLDYYLKNPIHRA